jgi:ribosomal protein S18 acetylase RimI-like enzyme
MTESDRRRVYEMMRVFYDSPALIHKSSDAVLKRDIDTCLSGNIFLEGYVFRENDEIIGYSMISKSFTTEYGGLCVWIEDLYFEEGWRNRGFGSQFFGFLERQYPEAVRFKLEVEKENEAAVATYKKNGYAISDYFLMTKEIDRDE